MQNLYQLPKVSLLRLAVLLFLATPLCGLARDFREQYYIKEYFVQSAKYVAFAALSEETDSHVGISIRNTRDCDTPGFDDEKQICLTVKINSDRNREAIAKKLESAFRNPCALLDGPDAFKRLMRVRGPSDTSHGVESYLKDARRDMQCRSAEPPDRPTMAKPSIYKSTLVRILVQENPKTVKIFQLGASQGR